jgi:8-hydroxy-5-deazaflavin:NADPH oxidoreductase
MKIAVIGRGNVGGGLARLRRDAGYEPVGLGGLDRARMSEESLALLFAANQAGLGPFFLRFARPGEL